MPKYKILGGSWGEGYKPGDVIEADEASMKVREENGDVEQTTENKVEKKKEAPKARKVRPKKS